MKERPIIFSAPMVRAILEGRKSQTRRVVKEEWNHGLVASEHFPYKKRKFQRRDGRDDFVTFSEPYTQMFGEPIWFYSWGNSRWLRSPYGVPGDRLWVRESYWIDKATGEFKWYVHPGLVDVDRERDNVRLRPAIHMPRSLSRVALEIKSIRVERVQEISEEDARAEGVIPLQMDHGLYRPSFEGLWDSINAKRGYGWDANPWVWVVEFDRVES